MKNSLKITCIIPARLDSQRFPKKLLSQLGNKPLLQWVWEAARACALFEDVIFAVDSLLLAQLITSFGGKWIMTSLSCNSGTERVIEIMKENIITADVWVNWQADEPFITSNMISELLASINQENVQSAMIWTLKKKITSAQELSSPSVAKVVCDHHDRALYFSRSIIPCVRDEQQPEKMLARYPYFKHIGLYAYTTPALYAIDNYLKSGSCSLEEVEKLEQLGFLYHHLPVFAHTTEQEVFGIDWPDDLVKAESKIKMQTQEL